MYEHRRVTAIAVVLTTVLVGCNGDTAGPALPPEIGDAPNVVDDLITPMEQLVAPVAAVREAFPALVDQGLSYDPATLAFAAPLGMMEPTLRQVASDVQIPATLAGETFVYDVDQSAWVTDPARTAPDSVVRIIWYATDIGGSKVFPLVEQGHVDLTDEDDGVGSRIGMRMVATTDSGDIVLADLTERQDTSTAGTTQTARFEGQGYYDIDRRVDFQMDYELATETAAVDSQYTIDVSLTGQSSSLDWHVSGSVDSTGTLDQLVDVTVSDAGTPTRLVLNVTIDASGSQSGNGTLSHAGQDVARIDVAGFDYSYTPSGGGSFSLGQQADLDSLIVTLYFAGLDALSRLPLVLLFD
ncbi:MAG: hypothetical protein R3314_07430 [Longimicrobiales bacterium]|nr:hypothetical protein [Longimicrobiales bacterium]